MAILSILWNGASARAELFCNLGKLIASSLIDSNPQEDAEVTEDETGAIFLEMAEMETFFHHCSDNPDEALLKVAKFIKVNPDKDQPA